jgi:uncharacterized membrane protein YkoI
MTKLSGGNNRDLSELWSENTRTINEASTQSRQIQDTFAMNTSIKVALIALRILGLLCVSDIARAEQSQEQINIRLECSLLRITEVTDENSEINDDTVQGAKLKSLAKINAQQTQKAAEAAQNGKTSSIELEAKNSNLVYVVTIDKNEVDAGNGKVLSIDKQTDKKTKGNHPHSSIQVFQSGDGDSENYDDESCK